MSSMSIVVCSTLGSASALLDDELGNAISYPFKRGVLSFSSDYKILNSSPENIFSGDEILLIDSFGKKVNAIVLEKHSSYFVLKILGTKSSFIKLSFSILES